MNNDEEFETLEAYWSDAEAQLSKNLLESAGIPCFLQGQATAAALWYMSSATGGIRLQVARSNLDRAEAVLQEARSGQDHSTDEADWNSPQAESADVDAEEQGTDDDPTDDESDSPSSDSAEDDEEREVLEQGGGLLAELRSVRRLILLPFLIGPILFVIVVVVSLIVFIFSLGGR